MYARRALRAIGEANDLAFGARTKQTARKSTAGLSDAELEFERVRDAHRSEAACARRIEEVISKPRLLLGGIPNPPESAYANSCFINAALQCLFAIPEVTFEDTRLRDAYDAIKRECSTGKPASLATAIAFRTEALRAMQEKESLDPGSVGVEALSSAIREHLHYDLTEFLSPLLDLVSGCTSPSNAASPSAVRAECPFEFAWVSRVSRVTTGPSGPVRSVSAAKITPERILHCPAQTAEGGPIGNVFAAVRAKMSPHHDGPGFTVDTDGGISTRTDYESQTTSYYVQSFPTILCISLSRFKMVFGAAQRVKIEDKIKLWPEIPLRTHRTDVAVYDLIAIAAHEGESASAGHYTAYTKRSRRDQSVHVWAKYNDALATPLSERKALAACRTTAYVLFYRLREVSKEAPPKRPLWPPVKLKPKT
jgi:hypothetical protein